MGLREYMKDFHWSTGSYVVGTTLAVLLMPLYFIFVSMPSWKIWVAALVLFNVAGLGITAGYHRYYAHKTYNLHKAAEVVILFFGILATQGPITRWSYLHRRHHRYTDTDKDPYNIKKGFWHAHILWMMKRSAPLDPKVISDLLKNKLVVFQSKHHFTLSVVSNIAVSLFVGWLFNDYIGAILVAGILRMFALHQAVCCINSLAHTFGEQPFSKMHSAVDNWFFAFFTFGEGYHNYHHSFAGDYRNGAGWYNYDPAKWIVWVLSKVGLASNLKRADFHSIKKQWLVESNEQIRTQLSKLMYVRREVFEKKLNEWDARIDKQLVRFRQLKVQYERRYEELKKDKAEKKRLRVELKALRKSINKDCTAYSRLCRNIFKLRTDLHC